MYTPFSRLFGISNQSSDEKENINLDEVVQIPVDQISPNPFQPRTVFNDEKIQELAQTIRTHGIIQPIVVRKNENNNYEIIAGERRWRAVQSLGWDNISAIIRDMNDTETASVALIENLQREELTAIEEANAYKKLIELHSLTQEALAQRLGKSQSTIANKLRLLNLPDEVQDALLNKELTERHARALITLKSEEDQIAVLNKIKEEQLNVKQTEELINDMNNPQAEEEGEKKKKRIKLKGINKDIRIALNTIRQSLHMVSDTGLKVETEEEDLEEFYQITIKIPKKQ